MAETDGWTVERANAALPWVGAALTRIHDLVKQGSQFLVATHSPVLLAVPGARILEITDDGTLEPVSYDDALPVRSTRRFLADPAGAVRALLS